MSECTHNCETCSENCAERDPKSFIEKLNEYSSVKKVIGVVSGKGGVGKSSVTSTVEDAVNSILHSLLLVKSALVEYTNLQEFTVMFASPNVIFMLVKAFG